MRYVPDPVCAEFMGRTPIHDYIGHGEPDVPWEEETSTTDILPGLPDSLEEPTSRSVMRDWIEERGWLVRLDGAYAGIELLNLVGEMKRMPGYFGPLDVSTEGNYIGIEESSLAWLRAQPIPRHWTHTALIAVLTYTQPGVLDADALRYPEVYVKIVPLLDLVTKFLISIEFDPEARHCIWDMFQ